MTRRSLELLSARMSTVLSLAWQLIEELEAMLCLLHPAISWEILLNSVIKGRNTP